MDLTAGKGAKMPVQMNNVSQIYADARERHDEVQISRAVAWVISTFDRFIKYTDPNNPEKAFLYVSNVIINPEDHATWARNRPLGHRESAFMSADDFALMFIDVILAGKIKVKDSSLLKAIAPDVDITDASARIAALIENDEARGLGHADKLRQFPNWRVEACVECGNPLLTVRRFSKTDRTAVKECTNPKCGTITKLGFKLPMTNVKEA